jgi:2'-5' RNA ligase
MYGIVAFLDSEYEKYVVKLWRKLQTECDVKFVAQHIPYPHFSLVVADGLEVDDVDMLLRKMATDQPPVPVDTAGIGIFTRPATVIYIPILVNRKLTQLHERVWKIVEPFSSEPVPYYRPDSWLPHITLAQGDIEEESLMDALRVLRDDSFHWAIPIHEIGIIEYNSGASTVLSRFVFTGTA